MKSIIEINMGYISHDPRIRSGNYVEVYYNGSLMMVKSIVSIVDNFNPINYSLVHDPEKYKFPVISISSSAKREEFLRNRRNLVADTYRKSLKENIIIPKVGDRIHLKTKNGTYVVVSVGFSHVEVTCNLWQHDQNKYNHTRIFDMKEIKCLYGKGKVSTI